MARENNPDTRIHMSAHPPAVPLNDELFAEICRRVAEGETLTEVSKDIGFSLGHFYDWRNSSQQRRESYAHAREQQAEAWSDEIVRLSRAPLIGEKTKILPDGSVEVTTGDNVERTKLQTENMKWLMARLHRARWGDRIDQHVSIERAPAMAGLTLNEKIATLKRAMAEPVALLPNGGQLIEAETTARE